MGSVFVVLFYALLIVGSISSMLTFILVLSFINIVINLNEKLAKLIEILFVLGEQKAAVVDPTIERIPGMGNGLQDIPNQAASYDPRYNQVGDSPNMKWGKSEAEKTWDENL